jgi:hypothetical protein
LVHLSSLQENAQLPHWDLNNLSRFHKHFSISSLQMVGKRKSTVCNINIL